MEHASLIDLIEALTYKNNVHICIIFPGNQGNYKTVLSRKYAIHSKPYCDYIKSIGDGTQNCVAYHKKARQKARETKTPFEDICPCGAYEYLHPLVEGDEIVAMIMIGNILLTDSPLTPGLQAFSDGFEINYPRESCQKLCAILEGHIRLLLQEYSDRQNEYPPLIDNIRSYLAEFLYSDISVSELATAFNYSEKYIGKLFKAHMGMSVREYVCKKRLEHGAKLLKNGPKTVTEIALSCGFNNVSYFNRMFKQTFGMTPSEYRKKE